MSITYESSDGLSEIAIHHSLTVFQVADYRTTLIDASNDARHIDLDLGSIEEVDTAGIQLLLSLARYVSASDREFQIISMSESVETALKQLNLLDALQVKNAGRR